MGWWTALSGAMGTRRADRIACADADQLLAGHPAGPAHAGLAALLSEAAAPPRPAELAGEADAVASFRRLRSATPATVYMSTVDVGSGGSHRRPRGSLWRGVTVRLAVAALLLATVGTAAVTLAFRPAHVQPTPTPVASSSVPAPNPSLSPSSGVHEQPPSTSRPPSPVPSPAAVSTGVGDLTLATQLCEAWITATDKATRDGIADRLAPLIDRLDGPKGLPAFCGRLVGARSRARTGSATTANPTTANPTTASSSKTKAKAAQVTPTAARSTGAKKGD